MNSKLRKSVVVGVKFIEHRFDRCQENFEGTWIKTGHKVEFNATNEASVCESCLVDQEKRKKNWSEAEPEYQKPHSYQVVGSTHPTDFYEWCGGKCKMDKKYCWGNVRRAFQLKREGNRYLFSSCIVHPHSRENLGR